MAMTFGDCENKGCYRHAVALMKVTHVAANGDKYGLCQKCRDERETPARGFVLASVARS